MEAGKYPVKKKDKGTERPVCGPGVYYYCTSDVLGQ
jgi:hypothetical protein